MRVFDCHENNSNFPFLFFLFRIPFLIEEHVMLFIYVCDVYKDIFFLLSLTTSLQCDIITR